MIEYKNNILHIDGVSAERLARDYGTPVYVYSKEQIVANCQGYFCPDIVSDTSLHYAVKANNNLDLLRLIKDQGFGFDIVSEGELLFCLKIGADPAQIVYSGVGKTKAEIYNALKVGIGCINVESFAELDRIEELATDLAISAPVAIRVNPHVDAKTHPGISTALLTSKFGIDYQQAMAACLRASQSSALSLKGIVCHIGSQIESLGPYQQACDSMIELYDKLVARSVHVEQIGLGGGLGVAYQQQKLPRPADLIKMIYSCLGERDIRLLLEPGRSIVANSGVTLTKVEYLKHGPINFAIIDAAMNDLPRPAIYGAWHEINLANKNTSADHKKYTVVGGVCESTDTLGIDRNLAIEQGDLLAVFDTGAYTRVMANNYNLRPQAPSVLIDQGKVKLIESRQDEIDLLYRATVHQPIDKKAGNSA